MSPKKTSAGSNGSAPRRRSIKKTSISAHPSNASHDDALKDTLEPSQPSAETPPTSGSPKGKVKKPRKTSASINKASTSSSSSKASPLPETIDSTAETAASGEPPHPDGQPQGRMGLGTALIFYLVFGLVLWAITLWNPAKPVSLSAPGPEGTVDLTERQIEFEAEWREKLEGLQWSGDHLSQTLFSRLREEPLGIIHPNGLAPGTGHGVVKWIRSEIKIVFSESGNEERLVETGEAWKAICESMGYAVSKTRWGYSRNTLWVVLDSEAEIEPGGRRLSLPMQRITLIQPIRGGSPPKSFFLRGLIPSNPPARIAPTVEPTPMPSSEPVLVAPTGKPSPLPKPTPSLKPRATTAPPVLARPPLVPPSPPKFPSPLPPQIKIRAKVAIIIDDVGSVRGPADALLKVPAPLTWSVMPLTPYGNEYMKAGKDHGFQIMLHLPLEPLDGKINPGPGVIKAAWPEEEIRQQLDEDLQSVPDAVGINNHMGSAGTADERLMNILMKAIKEKGLFFVDSMTESHSVAEKYARLYQIPSGKRRVFIDNQSTVESKKKQLRELIQYALKNGSAIGIGHARPNTADAIMEMLPEFVKAGVTIVPVSELVK